MASNLQGPIFRTTSNIQFVIPLMLGRDQVPAGAAWLGAGEPPFVSSVCITAVSEAVWSWDFAAGDVEKTELISLLLRTEQTPPPKPADVTGQNCKQLGSSWLTCRVVHVCSDILRSARLITVIPASQRSGCVLPWWCINICWEVIQKSCSSLTRVLWKPSLGMDNRFICDSQEASTQVVFS